MWRGSRLQLAEMEDRHKNHDNRGTLFRIFDSAKNLRLWTGNGPACQNSFYQTTEIHQTITRYASRENTGPFPLIESCWLLQQYFLWGLKFLCKKDAICPHRGSQADLEQHEIRPYTFTSLHWLLIRSWSSCTTLPIVTVRHTSAASHIQNTHKSTTYISLLQL